MPNAEFSPIFLGLVIAIALAEYFWRRKRKLAYDGKAVLATIGVAVGEGLSKLAFASVIVYVLLAVYSFAPWQFALDDWRT